MVEKLDSSSLSSVEKNNILIGNAKDRMTLKTKFFEYAKRVWDLFSSIKLSVVLLLALAGVSVIGTLIPQNASPEKYLQAYGVLFYKIFGFLGIFDLYHSFSFQLLIILLAVNLIVCSINRLKSTWKIIFVKEPSANISRFRKLSEKKEFTVDRAPESLQKAYEKSISKNYGYCRVEQTEKGFSIFAEKWRWTRLGVYLVHLSVILLLVGSLIGSIFGFDGYVNIAEGETVSSIRLTGAGKSRDLDFSVRCNDFSVSYYDSGAPKEFRSDLTILKDGAPVVKKSIIVNDPLRYEGVNLFQSSYGQLPLKEAAFMFKSTKTGTEHKETVAIGQEIALPDNMGKFILKGYQEAAAFRGKNVGEAFFGTLTKDKEKPAFVLLPLRYPSFDKMRRGDEFVSVAEYEPHYYTGLQVTGDPGVPVVYAGFILIIMGIFITFFMSHQQICVEVNTSGKKSKVMVAGISNKNKMGMQNKIGRLSQKLIHLQINTAGTP